MVTRTDNRWVIEQIAKDVEPFLLSGSVTDGTRFATQLLDALGPEPGGYKLVESIVSAIRGLELKQFTRFSDVEYAIRKMSRCLDRNAVAIALLQVWAIEIGKIFAGDELARRGVIESSAYFKMRELAIYIESNQGILKSLHVKNKNIVSFPSLFPYQRPYVETPTEAILVFLSCDRCLPTEYRQAAISMARAVCHGSRFKYTMLHSTGRILSTYAAALFKQDDLTIIEGDLRSNAGQVRSELCDLYSNYPRALRDLINPKLNARGEKSQVDKRYYNFHDIMLRLSDKDLAPKHFYNLLLRLRAIVRSPHRRNHQIIIEQPHDQPGVRIGICFHHASEAQEAVLRLTDTFQQVGNIHVMGKIVEEAKPSGTFIVLIEALDPQYDDPSARNGIITQCRSCVESITTTMGSGPG